MLPYLQGLLRHQELFVPGLRGHNGCVGVTLLGQFLTPLFPPQFLLCTLCLTDKMPGSEDCKPLRVRLPSDCVSFCLKIPAYHLAHGRCSINATETKEVKSGV